MHRVDLGESFQTHIFLQIFASIQPKTSPLKFARSSRLDPLTPARTGRRTPAHVLTEVRPAAGPRAGGPRGAAGGAHPRYDQRPGGRERCDQRGVRLLLL